MNSGQKKKLFIAWSGALLAAVVVVLAWRVAAWSRQGWVGNSGVPRNAPIAQGASSTNASREWFFALSGGVRHRELE